MKLYFVIPAFNEAENIPRLLANLQQTVTGLGVDFEVLLIDDGSSDGTGTIARALGVQVVAHLCNLGPGAAFQTGLSAALALAGAQDLIVTIEADNTSDLAILGPMLEAAQRTDVVLASVYGPGGSIIGASLLRRVLSWGANRLLAFALATPHLHTYSSFFRVYRPAALRRVVATYGEGFIAERGFVSMVELLIKLHLLGTRFEEIPMILDSAARSGKSKMRIGRTIRAYGRVLWQHGRGAYRPTPMPLEPLEDFSCIAPQRPR